MKKLLLIGVSATLALTACNTGSPSTLVQPGRTATSAQSTGAIKGQLILPYRLQTTTRVASTGFNLLAYVVGQPALAEEGAPATDGEEATTEASAEPSAEASAAASAEPSAEPSAEASATTDGPLTEGEVLNLTATVDDEPVALEVTEVEPSADGEETVVTYEIDEADVDADGDGDGDMVVVEIQTPEGEGVGSAVVDAEVGTTTEQDITPETTAVVETAVEIYGSAKIADLTEADLTRLALDPAVLNKAASMRSILRKDGTLKPNLVRRFGPHGKPSTSPSGSLSATPSADAAASHGRPKGKGKPEGKGKPSPKPSSSDQPEDEQDD
ncbi:MAG: hypothetical protein ACAI44_19660 [Candidatus Sericytochromatia bacterium]